MAERVEYNVQSGLRSSSNQECGRIDIIIEKNTDKKFSVFVFVGKDGQWGTADDYISSTQVPERGLIANKSAMKKAIEMIRNNQASEKTSIDGDNSATFLLQPLNEKPKLNPWMDKNLSLFSGGTIKKDKLMEIGFGDYESNFLEKFIPNCKDERAKGLIMKGLEKASYEKDPTKKQAIIASVYSYARMVERGELDTSGASSAAVFIADRLTGWTGQPDQEAIEAKIEEINSNNVTHFIRNFSWNSQNIFWALYDDCKDDANVCKKAYNHLYDKLVERMKQLGITKETSPGTVDSKEKAKAMIDNIEDCENGFWSDWITGGAWDYRIKDAADAMTTFANNVEWHESNDERVKGKSKAGEEGKLRELIN